MPLISSPNPLHSHAPVVEGERDGISAWNGGPLDGHGVRPLVSVSVIGEGHTAVVRDCSAGRARMFRHRAVVRSRAIAPIDGGGVHIFRALVVELHWIDVDLVPFLGGLIGDVVNGRPYVVDGKVKGLRTFVTCIVFDADSDRERPLVSVDVPVCKGHTPSRTSGGAGRSEGGFRDRGGILAATVPPVDGRRVGVR